METIVAEARITKALQSKLPPATKYIILPEDLVRVFREKSGRWEGPFTVTKTSKKIITVTDGTKLKPFNISAVLPVAPKTNGSDLRHDMNSLQSSVRENPDIFYPIEIMKASDPRTKSKECQDAIENEISGLLYRGAFKYMDRKALPRDANILGGRFVLSLKQLHTYEERYKARFVVQVHKYKEKEFIIHISKTVRHRNIKILLSIAVIYKLKVWNQDDNQAYIQGHELERDLYVIPDSRFNLPCNMILKLLKPLYGRTESGDSWFDKHTSFLEKKLGFTSTTGDIYFFYHTIGDVLQGLLAVYVHDSLGAGTPEFLKLTDKISEKFKSKPRESSPFQFAGILFNENSSGYFMEQGVYSKTIEKLPSDCDCKLFHTTTHRLVWIKQTRPEILAGVNILSQVTEEKFSDSDVKDINK